ncbi:MAG: ABC transporter ATP-binding protein [Chloroflexota bacterium]
MSLRLDGIVHVYTSPTGEPHQVLDIPGWELAPGDQVLLRGVSGSGKTTLFNIMAGLLSPTHGTVSYEEQSLYALPERKRDVFRAGNIGYIFQSHYLVSSLTALDNVVMPMAFAGQTPRHTWKPQAKDLLAQLGLADRATYRPDQLSTGQRLRVGIARALANGPRVLLADEPTAALDPDAAITAMDFIQHKCEEANAILVVASHDPALTGRFETVTDLKNGHLTTEHNPSQADQETIPT